MKRAWTIVLAAGDGARLRPLTRALYGNDLPKQFCPLLRNQSLLGATLQRAHHFSTRDRIVVIVAEPYEALARRELARHAPGAELLLQPRNLGTGPGILLPLSRVLARDPEASVVILPSDHHVGEVGVFAAAVQRALASANSRASTLLLGAVAERPDSEYGWIVAEPAPSGEAARLRRFVEKPGMTEARALFETGALWNTFVIVGHAARLWQLARQHLPRQADYLAEYGLLGAGESGEWLRAVYRELPPADFSRDVLQRAEGLEVLPLPACGWSDWGTPERVLAALQSIPEQARLAHRASLRLQRAAIDAGAGMISK